MTGSSVTLRPLTANQRPPRADGTVPVTAPRPRRPGGPREMTIAPEPALAQRANISHEIRQAAADRFPDQQRPREAQLRREAVEVERHRPRDIGAEHEPVRAPTVIIGRPRHKAPHTQKAALGRAAAGSVEIRNHDGRIVGTSRLSVRLKEVGELITAFGR